MQRISRPRNLRKTAWNLQGMSRSLQATQNTQQLLRLDIKLKPNFLVMCLEMSSGNSTKSLYSQTHTIK